MTIYYSSSTNGFFDSGLHGANIPSDAVEITKDRHTELMASQGEFQIVAGQDGYPELVPFVPEPLSWEIKRSRAYPPLADYLDGVVKGDQAQIDAYIAACLEVKAKFPKPESQ